MRRIALSLACCALSGLPPISAQTPPDQTFAEKVTVSEALMDVLVTDRDGNVIVGLGKDDFMVEDAGQVVPVASATFYSNRRFLGTPEEAGRGGIEPAAEPQERLLVFLIEDQREPNPEATHLLARQFDAGRRIAEWVRMEMLSSDWVAVLSYDRSLHVHQDFTHDRRAIETALASATTGRLPANRFPSRRISTPDAPSLLAGLPAGDALAGATPRIYEGMSVLARALSGLRGRKNLILFTRGMGKITSFGRYKPDEANYLPMQQALNAANVAVYPVDIIPTGSSHLLAEGMNQIAADTGGRYFYNFTNFLTPLRQIAQDTSGYYLLSFAAAGSTGGYRKVTVRTRNPEFQVRARQGYGAAR